MYRSGIRAKQPDDPGTKRALIPGIGDEYRETSCPYGESIIAGSTTEYQGLLLTLVKCQTNAELDCSYSQGSTDLYELTIIDLQVATSPL